MHCPYCDKALSFAVNDAGLRIEIIPGDVAICGCCTQAIKVLLDGTMARCTDEDMMALRASDPEWAMDLEDAQAVLRGMDRRAL